MPALPPEFVAIIIAFQPLFSKSVFPHATVLLIGAILTPGVRTVTAALRMMGLSQTIHFQNYHLIDVKPVNQRSIDKWKHRLSASEIGVIESVCAEGMARFGYEPTGLFPSFQDQMRKPIRLMYWRMQRWRYRKKRSYVISYQMLGRTRKRLSNLVAGILRVQVRLRSF